jgi:hypothetical protein
MIDRTDETPEAWADRRLRGDGATARGTSGARVGTSGAPAGANSVRMTFGSWALAVVLMALAAFVNVMTILDDARRRGVHMPLILPVTLEATSAVAALGSLMIVVIALRLAPPGRAPLWRTATVHVGGSFVFSGAHVALMTLLRTALFALAGHRYTFSLSELPYEYRKDLLTYLVIGATFWLMTRRGGPSPPAAEHTTPAAPATFDIRDGASILRVPVAEIVAARAAGNYVEFALEDGRRPLMRAPLSQVETALAPHGFVRTHRSWLVNAARVRALTAAGSGDFRIDLGCGLTAPLSRRYPTALAQLRAGRVGLP